VLLQVQRNDPLSLDVQRGMAELYLTAGRYEEAIETARRMRAVDPEFPFATLLLVRALTFAGRPADALTLLEPHKDEPGTQYWLAHAYVMTGRRAEVERMPAAHDDRYPYRQLVIYAALGDKDRAFEALDRVAITQPQRVGWTLMCPEMKVLRGDPRLAAFRRKFGLP
jgi:tetratricopeptide (TPR) repeat protein